MTITFMEYPVEFPLFTFVLRFIFKIIRVLAQLLAF